MDMKKKLNILEELLDVEENTLEENTALDQISQWDSIAVIALIAMFDDAFEKVITPEEVKRFRTLGDIMDAME